MFAGLTRLFAQTIQVSSSLMRAAVAVPTSSFHTSVQNLRNNFLLVRYIGFNCVTNIFSIFTVGTDRQKDALAVRIRVPSQALTISKE